jgi:hypothetical protein
MLYTNFKGDSMQDEKNTSTECAYREPDHPGMDFDAIAPSYDRNMQNSRHPGEYRGDPIIPGERAPSFLAGDRHSTGEFALAAARRCARSYAIDISPGMLQYAREKSQGRESPTSAF